MTSTRGGGCSRNYNRDLADRSAGLVKLIGYATKQFKRLPQMVAVQQVRGKLMTIIGCE
jgi:hypothetical protein